uniref:Integrase core domain containing protein n=1 Tax=Solanum tuberosum TaxID=4113 RepID=M1DPW0_SOLTU
MLNQPYEVVATLLDKMVETNKEAQKKYEWNKLVAQVDVLSKRVMGLEEQAREKEKNFSLRERKQRKRHEGVQSDDTSSLIQQKLDEHDKKLNDMKENIDMLNEVTTLNSMIIQLQDAQITHLMMDHYPPFAEDSPNYTMGDFEDEEYQSGAEWRATDPVGESSKTPVINAISSFDSIHPLSLDSVKLGELRKVLVIRPPDRRPRWSPPFEQSTAAEKFCKTPRSKNLFGEAPNHSEVKVLSPNGNELDKLQANAQKGR